MSTFPLNLAPALFGLSLLLTSCGHHEQPQGSSADAKIRNALMGTWTHDDTGLGSIRLDSNGTFFAQWNTSNRPMKVWVYEGTWAVTGDIYTAKTTKVQSWGTTNRLPEGRTDRYRIMTVDEEHLVWEADGQTVSLKREK